jgi:fusion and transport protein UGO1
MSTHREGVNPLRPYYIPPTIGERPGPSLSTPSSAASGNATGSSSYASAARDVLTDLDYNGYLGDSSPSAVQAIKELLDELIWKYTSVLMAQPFEVAKTILQVRDQDENAALSGIPEPELLKRRTSSYGGSIYDVRLNQSLLVKAVTVLTRWILVSRFRLRG